MTLPVIPGPFSFLESAGGAAGSVGGALEARRRRLDLEARQRLTDILGLIQSGSDPEPYLISGGAALERLGLAAPGQGAAALKGPAERARVALQLASGQAKGAEAGGDIAAAQVPVAGRTAEAGAKTAEAGARSAVAEAAGKEAELPVRQRIATLITGELQTPESGFGKLAARAAAGTLPYYAAVLHYRYGNNALQRQMMSDRFKLFFEPLDNASAIWRQRQQAHQLDRRFASLQFQNDKKALEEWDKQNPEPRLEAVQSELLQNAAAARGMTVEEYNGVLNETVGLVEQVEKDIIPAKTVDSLVRRAQEVLAGSKTADQVEKEITDFYTKQGTPEATATIPVVISKFKQILEEAQGAKRPQR